VRKPIFAWADNAVRVRTQNAVNGLALFDANNQPLPVNAMTFASAGTDAAVQFDLEFDASISALAKSALNSTHALCLAFDGGSSYSPTDCRALSFTSEVVTCECARLPGDFAAGLAGRELPEGSKPITGLAESLRIIGSDFDKWLWLLLLLLLLLCATLTVVGLLVLYHRRAKNDDTDTLQPYLDKAAGMGNLALLAAGDDVSDSSELERRDYALPVGVYEIPEKTEDSDIRREDFSWGLEGEPESADDQAAVESSADPSEAGRGGDTYKESRLAKMAGGIGAGATATSREGLTTDYDLDRTGDQPSAATSSKVVAGSQIDAQRPMATDAQTQARRDK